jgi:hypothetical protein
MSGGADSGGGVVPPPFETQAGVSVGENFGSAVTSAETGRGATGGRCVTTWGIGRSGSAGGGASGGRLMANTLGRGRAGGGSSGGMNVGVDGGM